MIFARHDPFGVWRQESWELLDPAVQRAGADWNEVDDEMARGHAALWLAVTDTPVAAMLTRKIGATMEVWFAGGAIVPGCLPFLERVLREARDMGMNEARLRGRKGWRRVMAALGWRAEGDDMVKDL